jgi:hypothetical protein
MHSGGGGDQAVGNAERGSGWGYWCREERPSLGNVAVTVGAPWAVDFQFDVRCGPLVMEQELDQRLAAHLRLQEGLPQNPPMFLLRRNAMQSGSTAQVFDDEFVHVSD